MRLASGLRVNHFVIAALFASLVGCGGGSSPSGGGTGSSGGGGSAGAQDRLLTGQYAFSFPGSAVDSVSPNFSVAAGSFEADGNGNITNGVEDVNTGQGLEHLTFRGTYSIGLDGRGTATLTTSKGASTFYLAMVSNAHGLLMRLDSQSGTVFSGSGTLDLQDPTAFSASKLQGSYVFGLAGRGIKTFGNNPLSVVALAGIWTMDGQGAINSGEMDLNDSTFVRFTVPLGGSYSVDSTGRGTAQIVAAGPYPALNFVFYVVNSSQLKFVETDSAPVVGGDVLAAANGPFSTASLKGGYAFAFTSIHNDFDATPFIEGGVLTADGNGNMTGVLDWNSDAATSLGNTLLDSYSFDASGRGFIKNLQLAVYPAANGTIELIETDTRGVSLGTASAQSGLPFGAASSSGNYAAGFTGIHGAPGIFHPAGEATTGQISADGARTLTGTLDINHGTGQVSQDVPLSASTYSVQANGYGNAAIHNSVLNFPMQIYQVDSNTILFLDSDQQHLLTGILQKQQF